MMMMVIMLMMIVVMMLVMIVVMIVVWALNPACKQAYATAEDTKDDKAMKDKEKTAVDPVMEADKKRQQDAIESDPASKDWS